MYPLSARFMDPFRHLHTVVILAALVGIFIALQRRSHSSRVRFWLVGWALMLVHFCLRLLPFPPGSLRLRLADAFDYSAVAVAGTMFLISVSLVCEVPRSRRRLLLLLTAPSVVLSTVLAWGAPVWPAVLSLGVLAFGGAVWYLLFFRRLTAWVGANVALLLIAGIWAMYRTAQGQLVFGFLITVLVIYGLTGALFWRRYRRASPGVVATAAGFLGWAAVWGIAAFLPTVVPRLGESSELWNIPKLIVAFGMIVTLLEDQSLAAQEAGERARQAGRQIQRFAEVTSRLLTGVEVGSLCSHIAQVITESAGFQRVIIFLSDDQRHLYVGGHAGISKPNAEQLQAAVSTLTADVLGELCDSGRQVAPNSFLCSAEMLRPPTGASAASKYVASPHWNTGDELLVPLRSPRGAIVGGISLDEPRDPARVVPEELVKIEMLAADLAVAMENASLHRQLVMTEKLAAIGRLIGGVAHELNNPLTAVLGYAEVLGERASDERTRREVATIHREAQRMRRIIENLLRFAQQNRSEHKQVSVPTVIDEVMHLRAYEIRGRGVQLENHVPATLPKVDADENQLKQVFLNVLSNALDAVETAPEKRITIEAQAQGDRVLLTFADSGPGFSDLNRVFDPFFTTKPVGKGAGLGLSICYGILKAHGGDIYAYNVHPHGACIAMEIPVGAGESVRAAGQGN